MKNKRRAVQLVEEAIIIVLLALVVILAVDLKKTKSAMKDMQEAENITVEATEETPEVTEPEVTEPEPEEPEVVQQPEEPEKQEETTSDNDTESVDNSSVSGNATATINWIENYPQTTVTTPLAERVKTHSSYDDTMAINARDKEIIANSTIDFSGVKIACLGDSLTQASNLSDESLGYPQALKDILGAAEVYNLGAGGSTVMGGDRGSASMVDRFGEIPEDTDIIIIFASTNDCLFENQWDFGHIEYDKRMTDGTFCGDLDTMAGGIKYKYIEHGNKFVKLLFVAPPATVLNTEVRVEQPGITEQSKFIDAIMAIVPPYGFEVIDMYNTNFLNSHDSRIKQEFVTDGVHPNQQGYYMIAEHLASEIIQRCEQ